VPTRRPNTTSVVSGLFVFHPLLRFCHRFSSAPAARRLTSFTGDSITFNIVASSACWKHVRNVVTSPSALIKTTAVADSWAVLIVGTVTYQRSISTEETVKAFEWLFARPEVR
jgi:hypothetical protein